MGYFWCSHSTPVRDCRACRKKWERRGYDTSSTASYDPGLQTVWFQTGGADHGSFGGGDFGGGGAGGSWDSGGSCGGDGGGGGGGGCD